MDSLLHRDGSLFVNLIKNSPQQLPPRTLPIAEVSHTVLLIEKCHILFAYNSDNVGICVYFIIQQSSTLHKCRNHDK